MFEKKCTLIQPNRFLAAPLGLLAVGTILEKHNYDIITIEADEPDDVLANKNADIFRKINSKLIGISFFSSQTIRVKYLIEGIKANIKDAIIICGGVHPTLLPEETLQLGADYVVIGEGEETIVELFNVLENGLSLCNIKGIAYKDGNGNCVKTPLRPMIKDLNSLPIFSYHLLDSKRFIRRNYFIRGLWLRCAHILTSRGCPSKCSFCVAAKISGRIVRERAVDYIIEELNLLKAKYKINSFYILDDTFVLKKNRVNEFCSKLKRIPYKFKWASQARADTLTEDMIIDLKSAGCIQIEFGVESGSQRVLDALNKGIKVEQIERVFELCNKHKMRTLANIMIDNPEEKAEDIEKTVQLIKKIKPTYVNYGFLIPYPGSDIYNVAIKNGWINKETNFNTTVTEDPILMLNFTKDELLSIMQSFYKKDSTMWNYLVNPLFVYDIMKYSIKEPLNLLKILGFVLRGEKIKARNLFSKIYL